MVSEVGQFSRHDLNTKKQVKSRGKFGKILENACESVRPWYRNKISALESKICR